VILKIPKIVRDTLKTINSKEEGFEHYPKVADTLRQQGYNCHDRSDHLSTYLTSMINKKYEK
jgi:hypothetical protein